MPFTKFLEAHTVSAVEMNNNFYHCAQGDWLPMTGDNLDYTTGLLDLGSDTYKYLNTYLESANLSGELQNTWNLISSYNIDSTHTYTSRIEFAGLNGDSDIIYLIEGVACVSAAANSWFRININSDSSSSYGVQYFLASDAIAGGRNTDSGGLWISNNINATTTLMGISFQVWLYAKSGVRRLSISKAASNFTGQYIYRNNTIDSIWNNIISTITSLVFNRSDGGHFNTNTTIKIFTIR